MWVEVEAELGSGYLQRLESGRVAQPVRPTLERILTALGSRYSERRDVLESFGYTVSTDPPTEDDIAWARDICRHELDASAFPAYVVDCTVRLIAWNRYVPSLFGIPQEGSLFRQLTERPLLASWFDPASPLARLVVEPDVFLPSMIRAFRSELQLVGDEPWSRDLVAHLLDTLPYFRKYWERVEHEPPPATATRALLPVRLAVPGAGVLEFRLAVEHFTRDARFRVVYFLPSNPATMRQCAEWVVGEFVGDS